MCNNNRDPFIPTLHSILLAPDLYDKLFLIIKLMSSGHTCLFQKGFCTVYFGSKDKNMVTLPRSAQKKHIFLGKIKEMLKKHNPSRKKIALELLHQILGHRSTIPLLDGDTDNIWEDIELSIDLDPFCTSCHIYYINKKAMSKNTLKPKAPFK